MRLMASRRQARREPARAPLEAIAAGIAHEVRNPLNALRINLSILEQELRELLPGHGGHVFEVLGRISGELRSLDDFVTEFLRYAGPPPLRRGLVEVRPLLEDLATFIGPECARKGVTLAVDAAAGPPRLAADAAQLKHALLNLVLNAAQATPAGGSILIATGGDPRTLEIVVADTGEGLAPGAAGRVFDAFYTTREGGTGLGLPIARRIAEAHGGTLTLRGGPGAGTTARLALPVRRAPR